MRIQEFQEMINKIEGIIHVKIIESEQGIEEIHILANQLRSPKQIVRDIESCLLATFDYRIDRKIISIAQIETDEYEPIKRIKFDGVSLNTSGNLMECNVKLLYEEEEYCIKETGLKTTANRKKIVAKATIGAVEAILRQSSIFDIQDVIITANREVNFVSVLVNMIANDNEETMIGSAIIKNDTNEAIAKATLDAINRRVQRRNFN